MIKYLSVKEACHYMACSRSHLYRICERGELVHYKIGAKALKFKQEDIDAYMAKFRVKSNDELMEE